MVLGSDGRKMSKSLKNYVAAPEVLAKYGADATRQWAAGGGATGSDIPFRWPDVEYGRRFLVKLWNVSGFAGRLLADYVPSEKCVNQPLDKWILSKTARLVKTVTEAMEKCQFNIVVEEIRNFTWHTFCDCYVEAVKDRLYRVETYGAEARRSAQYALYEALHVVLQLLAPVIPHVTEEIYQALFAEVKGCASLQLSLWPECEAWVDEVAEKRGELIVGLISAVRREKAERHVSLNTQVKKLTVCVDDEAVAETLKSGSGDIVGACKVEALEINVGKVEGREIVEWPNMRFTAEY
jgi:valyl-tRNA synthetase